MAHISVSKSSWRREEIFLTGILWSWQFGRHRGNCNDCLWESAGTTLDCFPLPQCSTPSSLPSASSTMRSREVLKGEMNFHEHHNAVSEHYQTGYFHSFGRNILSKVNINMHETDWQDELYCYKILPRHLPHTVFLMLLAGGLVWELCWASLSARKQLQ